MSTTTPSLDQIIDNIITHVKVYKNNFTTQVNSTFTRLTPKDVIRLVIIVGAYALLRPYLLKLGARFQAQDHDRDLDHEEIAAMRKSEGRGGTMFGDVEIPDDTDSEVEGVDENGNARTRTTGADWGKKARHRSRRVLKQMMAAEELRRQEEEEGASDEELKKLMPQQAAA